jgi:hypothetical protein
MSPHKGGVLVIDETGETVRTGQGYRPCFGYQYLSSVGRIANGIVCVSSVWADEKVYHPLDVEPYTPAKRLKKGRSDPAFRTKPQKIALELVERAREASIPFRAVVAECLYYGENPDFQSALCGKPKCPTTFEPQASQRKMGRGRSGAHPRGGCSEDLRWDGPEDPGDFGSLSCGLSRTATQRRSGGLWRPPPWLDTLPRSPCPWWR